MSPHCASTSISDDRNGGEEDEGQYDPDHYSGRNLAPEDSALLPFGDFFLFAHVTPASVPAEPSESGDNHEEEQADHQEDQENVLWTDASLPLDPARWRDARCTILDFLAHFDTPSQRLEVKEHQKCRGKVQKCQVYLNISINFSQPLQKPHFLTKLPMFIGSFTGGVGCISVTTVASKGFVFPICSI